MSEEEVIRLWKVNRTVHEMVRDRVSLNRTWFASFGTTYSLARVFYSQGYVVASDEIDMTLDEFRGSHCSQGGAVK
jgi:DNA-directed RNA polymerase I, II, and III subunit RPABC1